MTCRSEGALMPQRERSESEEIDALVDWRSYQEYVLPGLVKRGK